MQVEYGRENYTTIARLLKTGAMTKESLHRLETFFAPHDASHPRRAWPPGVSKAELLI